MHVDLCCQAVVVGCACPCGDRVPLLHCCHAVVVGGARDCACKDRVLLLYCCHAGVVSCARGCARACRDSVLGFNFYWRRLRDSCLRRCHGIVEGCACRDSILPYDNWLVLLGRNASCWWWNVIVTTACIGVFAVSVRCWGLRQRRDCACCSLLLCLDGLSSQVSLTPAGVVDAR